MNHIKICSTLTFQPHDRPEPPRVDLHPQAGPPHRRVPQEGAPVQPHREKAQVVVLVLVLALLALVVLLIGRVDALAAQVASLQEQLQPHQGIGRALD